MSSVSRATVAGLARFTGWALFGATVATLLVVGLPAALGWHVATVLTGSMEPAISPGDIVVAQPVEAARVHPGEVVVFRDPSRNGALLTHRVRAISVRAREVVIATRGDANNVSESWLVDRRGVIARVRYRIPALGHVAFRVGSSTGRLVLIVGPTVLLGALALWGIWRPRQVAQAP